MPKFLAISVKLDTYNFKQFLLIKFESKFVGSQILQSKHILSYSKRFVTSGLLIFIPKSVNPYIQKTAVSCIGFREDVDKKLEVKDSH